MTPLYQELHRWAAAPFIWGEMDCITCPCDWIMRVRGVDPAADVRGTYDSRGSCHRQTGFFADPIGVVDRYFSACGLHQVATAAPGDVGLIQLRDEVGRVSPCGALWLGAAWGCKGTDGVTTVRPDQVPVMAIWEVGYVA